MHHVRLATLAGLLALAASPVFAQMGPDCGPFEQLYSQSGMTFPWPAGKCCLRTKEFGYPWFSCTADLKVTVANLCCQGFKGMVPDMAGLTQLQTLILSTNSLSGPVPNLSGLTMLQDLEISANNLTGNVDGKLPASLQKCQIKLVGTNPGVFSAAGTVPQACTADNQVYSATGGSTGGSTGSTGSTGATGGMVSSNGKCGAGMMCPAGACCSQYSWCGTTEAHSSSNDMTPAAPAPAGGPAAAPIPSPTPTPAPMPAPVAAVVGIPAMSSSMSRSMAQTTVAAGMQSTGSMMMTMTSSMNMMTGATSPTDQAAVATNPAGANNVNLDPAATGMMGPNIGLIVGGVIGGIVGIIAIGALIYYSMKSKTQAEEYASISKFDPYANASKLPPHSQAMLNTPNDSYSKQDSRIGNGEAPVSNHEEAHYADRAPMLRAAILGANDGLVSVAAVMLGTAAAGADRRATFITGLSAIVAGALSMGMGEFVSVYAARDTEEADIERERQEFLKQPAPYYAEMDELAEIYCKKGLPPNLARKVAEHFHWNNSLEELVNLHAKEEFNIESEELSNAWQAAITSIISFSVGGVLPLLGGGFIDGFGIQVVIIGVITVLGLAGFGALGAYLGGAPMFKASTRVMLGGVVALGITIAFGAPSSAPPTSAPFSFGVTSQPAQPSLFGASTQAPSLFGQPAPSTTGGSSFFGQPAGTAAPGGPSLFGQPAAQQFTGVFGGFGASTQPPAAGSLFGQPGQPGLFGQPAAAAPAAGGLFGQPPQQFQPPATQEVQLPPVVTQMVQLGKRFKSGGPENGFRHFFYNLVDPNQVHLYGPPPTADPAVHFLYRQAAESNPDPSCLVPALASSFSDIARRVAAAREQSDRARQASARLREAHDSLAATHQLSTAPRTQMLLRNQKELTHRLVGVMRRVHAARARGAPLSADEEEFKARVEVLWREAVGGGGGSGLRGRIEELKGVVSRVGAYGIPGDSMEMGVGIDEDTLGKVFEILSSQTDALTLLTETIRLDLRDARAVAEGYQDQSGAPPAVPSQVPRAPEGLADAARGATGSSLMGNISQAALVGVPQQSAPGQTSQSASSSLGGFGQLPTSGTIVNGSLFGPTPTTTSATNGLFGAPAVTGTQASLFGATTTVQQPANGSLFGMPAATAAPTGGSLFGPPGAPQAGASLFGASTQAGGSLFGPTSANTSAFGPPAAGSLFGAPAASQAPLGALGGFGAPASGGLFGTR
ncbi:hypothetical protein HDU93_006392 [Gonapodya sp. JEL0774]|nr:hypothetical protein HDU93_006392 [Gonapodya sp. JEL0774]